jgi:hypothetical protein
MQSERPLTPSTTDWEALFEDPDSGLIPLISSARSTDALRESSLLTIERLFTRKGDERNQRKFKLQILRLVPEGDEDGLEDKVKAVEQILRDIKVERIRKAAAYNDRLAAKARRESIPEFERREPVPLTPQRLMSDRPLLSAFIAILCVAAMALVFVFFLRTDPVAEVNVGETVRWVRYNAEKGFPNDSWQLRAVETADRMKIVIAVELTDTEQISRLRSQSDEEKLAIARLGCPKKGLGISAFVENGGVIWVKLESGATAIAEGPCAY